MFDRIKGLYARFQTVWKYSGAVASVTQYIAEYPGLEKEEELRDWIRPVLLDCSVLTTITKTTLDDLVTFAALKMVDSDRAWKAFYSLLMLVLELRDGRVKIPGDTMRTQTVATCNEIVQELKTENPALVIAAIGLVIQILQYLRRR